MRSLRGSQLAALSFLLATPLAAQRHARGVYVDAGTLATITDLNTSGTSSLKGGLYFGGGVSWQPIATDSSLLLTGDFTWNRQTLHTLRTGDGTHVDNFYYGLNLDYVFFTHRRFEFTVGGGGGLLVIHAWDSTGASRARPFVRLGLGARYVAQRRLQLFLQTFGVVYELRNFPSTSVLGSYSRRQSAAGIGLGAALEL